MPKIVLMPHNNICPDGFVMEADSGEIILDVILRNGINIEHACEKSCVCATCHCIIRKGFESLNEITEKESDALDRAWGLDFESRLSCQAKVANSDLMIEIPQYTVNYTLE